MMGMHDTGGAMLRATVYLWHLVVLPLTLIVMLLGSMGKFAWLSVRRVAGIPRTRPHEPEPDATADPDDARISRRQMLAASIAAAPLLLTGGALARAAFQLDNFRIRQIDVPLPTLPAALDGTRIAVVSDMHVGRFTKGDTLKRIAEATNELDADLVLFPGDVIDFSLDALPDAVETVRAIDTHQGLFLCEGNHDLFDSREGFEQGIRGAGLNLLLNEAETVDLRGVPVQVLGLAWGATHGMARRHSPAIEENLAHLEPLRNPDAFQILLAHHPHAFDSAAEAGIPLTLSGHTHGGQLMLTQELGAGPMMFKYWSGLYTQRDSALVVSNGVGNWFPLRTSAPAEILHLVLRKA
jgi:uncharacterized protein